MVDKDDKVYPSQITGTSLRCTCFYTEGVNGELIRLDTKCYHGLFRSLANEQQ